jgi:hypothetical protein
MECLFEDWSDPRMPGSLLSNIFAARVVLKFFIAVPAWENLKIIVFFSQKRGTSTCPSFLIPP